MSSSFHVLVSSILPILRKFITLRAIPPAHPETADHGTHTVGRVLWARLFFSRTSSALPPTSILPKDKCEFCSAASPHRRQNRLDKAVVLWFRGSVAPWFRGAVVPWCRGSVVPWVRGSVVPWFRGSVPWFRGFAVPWFRGSVVYIHTYMLYIQTEGKKQKNTKKERKRKLCAHCQLKRARRPGGSERLAAVRIQSNTHVFDVFGGRAPDWTSGL